MISYVPATEVSIEEGSFVIDEEMSPSTLSSAVAPGSVKGSPTLISMVLSPWSVI